MFRNSSNSAMRRQGRVHVYSGAKSQNMLLFKDVPRTSHFEVAPT